MQCWCRWSKTITVTDSTPNHAHPLYGLSLSYNMYINANHNFFLTIQPSQDEEWCYSQCLWTWLGGGGGGEMWCSSEQWRHIRTAVGIITYFPIPSNTASLVQLPLSVFTPRCKGPEVDAYMWRCVSVIECRFSVRVHVCVWVGGCIGVCMCVCDCRVSIWSVCGMCKWRAYVYMCVYVCVCRVWVT